MSNTVKYFYKASGEEVEDTSNLYLQSGDKVWEISGWTANQPNTITRRDDIVWRIQSD